ncbi:MAG: Lrp/AsnC family transcriptional regulator [Solirubrobacteraceae bacterium]
MADDVDREILSALSENSRCSYTELGRRVCLSANAVTERVRRLRETGVLRGFSIAVDQRALGRGLEAVIDVRLLPRTDPDGFERIAGELSSLREIAFLTGAYDYQLRVACEDADDLDNTVRALRQQAGAAQTETRIVLRTRSFPAKFGRARREPDGVS